MFTTVTLPESWLTAHNSERHGSSAMGPDFVGAANSSDGPTQSAAMAEPKTIQYDGTPRV